MAREELIMIKGSSFKVLLNKEKRNMENTTSLMEAVLKALSKIICHMGRGLSSGKMELSAKEGGLVVTSMESELRYFQMGDSWTASGKTVHGSNGFDLYFSKSGMA